MGLSFEVVGMEWGMPAKVTMVLLPWQTPELLLHQHSLALHLGHGGQGFQSSCERSGN